MRLFVAVVSLAFIIVTDTVMAYVTIAVKIGGVAAILAHIIVLVIDVVANIDVVAELGAVLNKC